MTRALCMALLLAALTPAGQGLEFPALPDHIDAVPARSRPDLVSALAALKAERTTTLATAAAFDRACGRVLAGSAEDRQCGQKFPVLAEAAREHHRRSVEFLADYATARRVRHTIDSMNALARRLRWAPDELARLEAALEALGDDGNLTVTGSEVNRVWRDVLARGPEGPWARDAAAGQGPVLQAAVAGTQRFNDCTIFALANATGEPYGVVAARAAELIRQGPWRTAADRAAPQRALERGLMGGEVIMLAEAFGEAEVVASTAFAASH